MPNHVEQAVSRTSRPPLNLVNEQYPGGQQTLTGVNQYAAQLGSRMYLDGNPGGVRYDTSIGTLYGGCFQYVQVLTGRSDATIGYPVAWYDFESYIVDTTISAVNVGKTAGIALCTITAAYYGWIQTKGKVYAQFKTGLTAATPADGDLVIVDYSTGLLDDPTQSGSPTYATLKAVIGVALQAPVSATLKKILLWSHREVI